MRPTDAVVTERVNWSVATACRSELWVRRLDLAHPLAPGNKAWKLRYHLERAQRQPSQTLLTFGGAWSNHLHAAAALGAAHGLRTIGVVRGEAHEITDHPTPTLRDCMDWGMTLFPVSRAEYREKSAPFFRAWLRDQFDNPWIVPEGAGDALGVMGCQHLVEPDDLARPADAFVVSAGTGATAAGLVLGLKGASKLYVASALKGSDLSVLIEDRLTEALADRSWARELAATMHVWNDAHCGGFGTIPPEVQAFIYRWEAETKIPLDGVYTAKTLMRLQAFLEQSDELHGKRILFVHTGGLQGNRSWR